MRLRQNKNEIECTGCGQLTESTSAHPVTKTGNYCEDCRGVNLGPHPLLPMQEVVHTLSCDIHRDDHEPIYANQVMRDTTTLRRSTLCTDPGCNIKLPGHSHYRKIK